MDYTTSCYVSQTNHLLYAYHQISHSVAKLHVSPCTWHFDPNFSLLIAIGDSVRSSNQVMLLIMSTQRSKASILQSLLFTATCYDNELVC